MKLTHRTVVGCVVGTRPELIKMAPVIWKLRAASNFSVKVINTAQHRGLIDDMLNLFQIEPDFDLNCMHPNQSLANLTAKLCQKLDKLLLGNPFELLLAVGDTTSVLVSALCAFYRNVLFGHIEAGMRSKNRKSPFPEEMNRVLASQLANLNFAPTEIEKQNLIKENIQTKRIWITGNPVIDALFWVKRNTGSLDKPKRFKTYKHTILLTLHRRENIGQPLNDICHGVLALANKYSDIEFVLPLHPNPEVQQIIQPLLCNNPQISIVNPMSYVDLVRTLENSLFVMTDSGGLQEEAPALSKPVLVLREVTERPLVIERGLGVLVGSDPGRMVEEASRLIESKEYYHKMAKGFSPYGDGRAAERILECIEQFFNHTNC